MKPREEHINRNFIQNEYGEQELGQPVGLLCLLDEMCLMVCSFCKDVKEFNEMLSLINHIKICHSSIVNSKIFSKFANEIKDEFIGESFAKYQGMSLTSETDNNSIKHDGYLPSQLFKNENSTIYSKSMDLQDFKSNRSAKFPKQNLPIRCEKDIDEPFNAVEIHENQFYCCNCKLNFQLEKELLEHTCSYDASENGVLIKRRKQLFQCEVCSATLSSKRNLDVHLRRHTGEKTHNCQYCSDSFYTSNSLKNHLVTHTGELNYKCEYCDKTFSRSGTLWKHRKRNHLEHLKKRSNREHLHHQKNQITNDFLCNQCDSHFQLEDELRQHICIKAEGLEMHAQSHTGEPYKCDLCSLGFCSKDLLKKHMPKHAGERYKCKYENCGKSYSSLQNLRSHILVHTGKKPFKCAFCSLEFHKRILLKYHMAKHKEGGRFKCQYENCDRSYSFKSSLVVHCRSHTGEKPYKCELCSRTFSTSDLLREHMAKHAGKRYKCEYKNCDRSFSHRSSLFCHKRSHIEEKPFTCELCPLAFSSKGLLKQHMPKHTGERYKCKYENCCKSYSTLQNLRSHVLTHTGEKPFKCTSCPLEFHLSDSLKYHMAKHMGERFNCKYENCGKSYSTLQNLRSHVLTHTGEKPFKCTICSVEFHRRILLKFHMVKHKGERFKCEHEGCDRSYLFKASLVSHMRSHI